MRSLVRSVYIAAGIVCIGGVQQAAAQIVDAVEFTTKFPFTVGSVTMPAGSYTITPDVDAPAILEVIGEHMSAFVQTSPIEASDVPSKTEITFKRYGDGYVLKNIWVEGSIAGAETIVDAGERHVSKRGAFTEEHRLMARKKGHASKND